MKKRSASVAFALSALLLASSCGLPFEDRREFLVDMSRYIEPPRRPVIVLPGFAACKLFDPVTQRYVWGTAHSTLQTRYADNLDLPIDETTYAVGQDRLIPRGYIGSRGPINIAWQFMRGLRTYGLYSENAEGDKSLYPFFYDWRLGYETNARRLDAFIEQIRAEHGDPSLKVDLLGYSAGGMVALAYLKMGTAAVTDPGSWDESARRAGEKINRLVLVAPPQDGVVDSLRVLHRGERFVMRVMSPEIVSSYVSLVQLLPTDGRFLIDENGAPIDADLWNIASWRRLGLSIFDPGRRKEIIRETSQRHWEILARSFERSLREAKLFNSALQRPLPPGVRADVIAGDCVPTTVRVLRRNDGTLAFYRQELLPSEGHLAELMFSPGDGSVPLASATAHHAASAFVFCDGHQQYAADPSVHRAIIRSLQARTGS